jgi:hypothetical protein
MEPMASTARPSFLASISRISIDPASEFKLRPHKQPGARAGKILVESPKSGGVKPTNPDKTSESLDQDEINAIASSGQHFFSYVDPAKFPLI